LGVAFFFELLVAAAFPVDPFLAAAFLATAGFCGVFFFFEADPFA
jgi:hypothetical protein